MLDTVLFKHQEHVIDICCPSHVHGIFGQFIHRREIACQPMSVGEIETITLCLEKGLTRFSTRAEGHIIALHIPTPRDRHPPKHKYGHHKGGYGASRCRKHTSP